MYFELVPDSVEPIAKIAIVKVSVYTCMSVYTVNTVVDTVNTVVSHTTCPVSHGFHPMQPAPLQDTAVAYPTSLFVDLKRALHDPAAAAAAISDGVGGLSVRDAGAPAMQAASAPAAPGATAVAAPAPAVQPAPAAMNVQIPQGMLAGQNFIAQAPDGQHIEVPIPAGATAGMMLQIKYQPKAGTAAAAGGGKPPGFMGMFKKK
jgi:hypothetical protein